MKFIKVYGDRVLVQERQSEVKKLDVGIIIPDTVDYSDATGFQKHFATGTILKAGERCSFAQEGELILFARGDSAPIEFQDVKYQVLRDPAAIFSFDDEGIKNLNSNRVLIAPDPMEKITKSGLIIPENANYEPITGEVIRVGHQCRQTKEKDRVLFGKAAGAPIEFRGKVYLCLREEDVVGTV